MQRTESMQEVEAAEAAESARSNAREEISPRRRRRDSGAMLLAVLFMMAMMVIVALAVAPSFVQQMHRDREEEMIHRGTEYARAIKKFYKKFGRYPANLDQLDNTNQMRFLRRRFKDPMSKDGGWKLLRSTDPQVIAGGLMVGMQQQLQPGAPGVPLGQQGAVQGAGLAGVQANAAVAGMQLTAQQPDLSTADQTVSSGQTSGLLTGSGGTAGQAGSSAAPGVGQGNNPAGNQNTGAPGQSSSNNSIFGETGVGGQTFGGGAIVGVASKDKDVTIRVFNKKKTYDEWMFVYSPLMDRVNVLLRGPFNGQSFPVSQVGTPAGQLNNPATSGQQPGGLPQQPGGFGQQGPQQNQQNATGNQFPPDQNQPPQ